MVGLDPIVVAKQHVHFCVASCGLGSTLGFCVLTKWESWMTSQSLGNMQNFGKAVKELLSLANDPWLGNTEF